MESSIEYIIYHFKILNVILYFHNFGQRGRVKMRYRVLCLLVLLLKLIKTAEFCLEISDTSTAGWKHLLSIGWP